MRKLIFFMVALLGSTFPAQAQSQPLTGMWLGKLHQNQEAPFDDYNFRMELKQVGTRVTGTSYISLPHQPELHAKMTLEGRWEKGLLSFHEIELLDAKHTDGWQWCLKSGELQLKQVGQYRRLEGKWEGYLDDFPCKPGTLALEKLNPQAQVKEPPKVAVPEDKTGEFGSVEGRTITRLKEVPIRNETFTVYIWDGDKVDGDIVSMQYNGEWLLRKFPISKTKKALRLEIVPGAENQLVLYAENEGQYPPNTAAITFFDGKEERNLNLSSDEATCGALKFILVR